MTLKHHVDGIGCAHSADPYIKASVIENYAIGNTCSFITKSDYLCDSKPAYDPLNLIKIKCITRSSLKNMKFGTKVIHEGCIPTQVQVLL